MLRFSGGLFRWHGFRYSTLLSPIHPTTSGDQNPKLIVNYLIDSLRFSEQDAVSLTSKGNLTHLKSTINSDLVINVFKNYGLNHSQIKQIVSCVPKILTCKANKTLEPKIRFFHQLGLTGSDLVILIKKNPSMFGYGLHTRIIPGIDHLRKLLGSDEKVRRFVNRSKWLYATNRVARLSANVNLLQDFGLSEEMIIKFVSSNPDKLMVDQKLLENRLTYVEEKLGISRVLPAFIHAVSVTLYCSDSEVETRMQIFRSFGWSDSDILSLFRNQPYCLSKSGVNIRKKLEFYMEDLGYTRSYLISCNSFFTCSLNKRVKPRYKMLEILKEKKLVNDKPNLVTIVSYSELRFFNFLRGFEDHIPRISEIYMDSVGRAS